MFKRRLKPIKKYATIDLLWLFIRQLCSVFCLLYATGSAAQEHASAEQLRFVTTNSEFTLLHEMGHLLIHELQLPVLGREEDAADQLGFIGLFLTIVANSSSRLEAIKGRSFFNTSKALINNTNSRSMSLP